MIAFFNKKATTWLGVDIGSSAVKLVAMSKVDGQLFLDSYAVVSLPPSAIIDGHLQEIGIISEAIEKGIKICGSKLSVAITSVPSSAVIVKRLEMSTAYSELELEDQIKVEADQFIPYPLDEVAIDFEIQGVSKENPGLNSILLVACRSNDVLQREAAISSAGLKCDVVDVDTFAIERLLSFLNRGAPESDDLIAAIDIGSATLTLNVMQRGEIVYNREQNFGSSELINTIHVQFGMTIEEIDQSLRIGEISDEIESMIIEPFKNTIVQQVSRALQFYYSSNVQNHLSRIYLSGGCTSIKGLVPLLQDEVGIPIEMANPFADMNINSKINKSRLEKDIPLLVKGCGLALRFFDR